MQTLATRPLGASGVLHRPSGTRTLLRELVDEGQPFSVVVDYAQTPEALKRAIESVRKTGANNVITVFGCGGDRDASKRAEMGRVADEYSDIVFVTNDNPRTEDPYKILDDIAATGADLTGMDLTGVDTFTPFDAATGTDGTITLPDGATCTVNGNACSDGSECCSGICNEQNLCAETLGNCDLPGTACVSGASCCSGRCADDGSGQTVCLDGTGDGRDEVLVVARGWEEGGDRVTVLTGPERD